MIETKFKRTEVGLIPEDWDIVSVAEVGDVITGSTPSTNIPKYYGNEFCFVSPFDLGYNKYIDSTNKNLTYLGLSVSRKIPKGSILYTCTGSTIGKIGIANKLLTTNQQINSIVVNSSFSNEFVYYAIQTRKEDIKKMAAVQAVPLITKGNFSKAKFACPNTPAEQKRIATALSDIDDLISSMRKLIEKKKNIKTGVMQELLSGKKRLKGFTGVWNTVETLRISGKIKRGQTLKSEDFCNGNVPVVAGGKKYAGYHNVPNQIGRTVTISGSGANAGYIAIHQVPIFATDCSVISESESFSLDFLFYLLSFRQEDIYKLQTGGAQPHVYPRDVESMIISIPSAKDEQEAIAKVLSDIDAEIEQLEMRLTKYEDIKQGMMQQLLTGKIRLI